VHTNPEVRAVIDSQIMVPAIIGKEPHHGFYMLAIRKCWKFVFSEVIVEEYQRVIQDFGFRGDVVIHALNWLYAMNKYRTSRADHRILDDELAPRKDKHIVAACQDVANVLVSTDRGILARKDAIERRLGVQVMSLEVACSRLNTMPEC
jgi:predicted nucleic acid-binding protein